jgi:hypothetical protein
MSMRPAFIIGSVVLVVACGRGSPTVPSAPAAPAVVAPFLITGHVYDRYSRPVDGAHVEVIDATPPGQPTMSDADGVFTLTAPFGSRLRATKDGYQPAIVQIQTAPVAFYLAPFGTLNLSGRYTLTIDADPACVSLPPVVRTRTYEATVEAAASTLGAPYFIASITGQGLDRYFNFFAMRTSGDTVDFDMSDTGIVQEIGDETYFSIGGYGSVSGATESGVSTLFNGTIAYCEVKPGSESAWPCAGPVVAREQCQSSNHRLTLTRR